MKEWIRQLPLALASLLLGTAALGNLLAGFWPPIRLVLQLPVLVGLLCLLGRLWLTREGLSKEFASPLVASCFAAFLMLIQLLIGALPLPYLVGKSLWFIGLLVYLSYMVYFTRQFVFKRQLNLVYPSWFVVYVGLAMVSVTAPVYEQYTLGWLSFALAGLGFVLVLPFVIWRLRRYAIEEAYLPILAILAAPLSLLLTAYLSLATSPQFMFAASLALPAQLVYGFVVFKLPKWQLASGFSPLYAAFTFPVVSTAIGFRLFLSKLGLTHPVFVAISYVEIVLALVMVAYVSYGYVGQLLPLRQLRRFLKTSV